MLYNQIKEIPVEIIKEKLELFFQEDQTNKDITTNTFVDKNKNITAKFVSEYSGVFCGMNIIESGFSDKVKVQKLIQDGFKIKPETVIANITGPADEILKKERVILNLIQRMSGVATETNQYAVKGYRKNIKILDTRKTTPGLRIFEKYATQCGGGFNHRFDLSKGVMIKDNHISSNEDIEKTLKKLQTLNVPIQVEIDTVEQLRKCLQYSEIDAVLLDNMDPETIKDCIDIIKEKNQKIFIEVSGGITLKTLNRFLINNVDAISIGSTIHQATAQNIKLEID